jgi:pimeloyl-ACP methyl ester carboxylesterase
MRRLVRVVVYLGLFVVTLVAAVLVAFTALAHQREVRDRATVAPGTGRFVKAADVEMFVQEMGPRGGPAVLLVHGTGAWSETWRESLAAVAAAGFRAIAIDVPPFGFSQRPTPPRYGKADQGRRIVGVLDALQIPHAVLVGHSFGGGPTVEATLLAPDRVRGLVLVDAALSVRTGPGEAAPPPWWLRRVLATPPVRDAVVATFLTNPMFTRRLLQRFIADPAAATPERVAVYQQPLDLQGSTRAVGEWLPALLAPTEAAASEDPASYRALRMPVFVVWGDRDTVTPLDQGQRLAGLAPGAQLHVMAGVGHIPQIEDARRFNELLLSIVSRPDDYGPARAGP